MNSKTRSRESIAVAASNLFYRFGFQAVGVDRIVEESGISKMTLYRYFPSKDDLIVEYLNRSAEEFWHWFDEGLAAVDDPLDQIVAVFDRLEDRCRSARFVGCTFQSVAAEFPDRDHPANRVAREHKELLRDRFEALLQEADVSDPRTTANQLMLIMEGALASARVVALPVPAREAGGAARAIIKAQQVEAR